MGRFAVSRDLFHLGFFGARSRVPARFRVSVDVRQDFVTWDQNEVRLQEIS